MRSHCEIRERERPGDDLRSILAASPRPAQLAARIWLEQAKGRVGAIGHGRARWLRSRRRATRLTALFHRTNTPRAKIGAEDETPAPAGPRSAGDVLRQQRAALGLDLGEVARELRIKPVYLAALEEGRPDRLPGPAYAIGFLRVYGDHLGLDSGEILRRFRLEAAGLDAKPDLSFPMPLGERSLPGRTALLVAVVLTICGYASWYYLATGEHSRPERVTEVPANLLLSNSALPSNWAKPATAPITGPAAPAAPTLSATPSTSTVPSPVSAIVNAAGRPRWFGGGTRGGTGGCFAVACYRQQPGCGGRRPTGVAERSTERLRHRRRTGADRLARYR